MRQLCSQIAPVQAHHPEADGLWAVRCVAEAELLLYAQMLNRMGALVTRQWRADGDRHACYVQLNRLIRLVSAVQELIYMSSQVKRSRPT